MGIMLLDNNHTPDRICMNTSPPLTEAEAADRLGLKVATLRAWRHQRKGPAFVRLGRAVRYLAIDIETFLSASRVGPMSDADR
jgi:predicted DNA-binding transcriptional regulator AlpA